MGAVWSDAAESDGEPLVVRGFTGILVAITDAMQAGLSDERTTTMCRVIIKLVAQSIKAEKTFVCIVFLRDSMEKKILGETQTQLFPVQFPVLSIISEYQTLAFFRWKVVF